MKKRICDICGKREAVRYFRVQESKKGYWIKGRNGGGWWDHTVWTPPKDIDICSECGNILLNLPHRNEYGQPAPPPKK